MLMSKIQPDVARAQSPLDSAAAGSSQQSPVSKRAVFGWVLWDWATQPYHTVLLTFVWVSLYLVSDNFLPPEIAALNANGTLNCAQADASSPYCTGLSKLSSDYGLITFFAGLIVLVLAPVLGQQADSRGQKKRWVMAGTAVLALLQFAMFFVEADPKYFWLGAACVALGSVASEIAGASYNALLFDVSTSKNIGRVSGWGWGAGYLGGITAMTIVVVLTQLKWLGMDTSNGMAFRVIAAAAAVWTIVFSLPFFLFVPEPRLNTKREQVNFFKSYAYVAKDLVRIFKHNRPAFWVLVSSAVYRDGLTGVFAFGAILASLTFGFSATEVMLFGVALNIVAGISTVLVGWLDDKLGPRTVIILSLLLLLACLLFIFFMRDSGKTVFWIGGLVLSATVGPAQSASRSLLSRLTPQASQGEVFGLYATTGRAVSFLAPAAWTIAVSVFGAAHFGALGIGLVVTIGLVLFAFLVPKDAGRMQAV